MAFEREPGIVDRSFHHEMKNTCSKNEKEIDDLRVLEKLNGAET